MKLTGIAQARRRFVRVADAIDRARQTTAGQRRPSPPRKRGRKKRP